MKNKMDISLKKKQNEIEKKFKCRNKNKEFKYQYSKCEFISDLIEFRYNKKTELGKCRFQNLETIDVLTILEKMENFLNGLTLKKQMEYQKIIFVNK